MISHSYLKMFVKNLILYQNVISVGDCELLQRDTVIGGSMSGTGLTWQLNPLECEALNITNKCYLSHFNCYVGSVLIFDMLGPESEIPRQFCSFKIELV